MNIYMDIKELSDYLHVKRSTLYAWVEEGRLPHVKLGRLIRFRRDEIDEWLHSHKSERRRPLALPHGTASAKGIEAIIASAKREVYTARRGETRPNSSLIRKEEGDGAV